MLNVYSHWSLYSDNIDNSDQIDSTHSSHEWKPFKEESDIIIERNQLNNKMSPVIGCRE